MRSIIGGKSVNQVDVIEIGPVNQFSVAPANKARMIFDALGDAKISQGLSEYLQLMPLKIGTARPENPRQGWMFLDTDTGALEIYFFGMWQEIAILLTESSYLNDEEDSELTDELGLPLFREGGRNVTLGSLIQTEDGLESLAEDGSQITMEF